MSLPESFAYYTPRPGSQELELRKEFLRLTEGMGIPERRRLNYDYPWLRQHLHCARNHPGYAKLKEFLDRPETQPIG